jgi:hypothetical protein
MMNIVRAVLGSTRGKVVLGALAAYLGWQAWLTAAVAGKIEDGFPENRRRVNVLVTLPFTPERFHVLKFQDFGRVSGTTGNAVEIRGVRKEDLRAIARPYWVRRVEPLPTNGG